MRISQWHFLLLLSVTQLRSTLVSFQYCFLNEIRGAFFIFSKYCKQLGTQKKPRKDCSWWHFSGGQREGLWEKISRPMKSGYGLWENVRKSCYRSYFSRMPSRGQSMSNKTLDGLLLLGEKPTCLIAELQRFFKSTRSAPWQAGQRFDRWSDFVKAAGKQNNPGEEKRPLRISKSFLTF